MSTDDTPTRLNLTTDQCEKIFHATLSAGDAPGVEAALGLLAVKDPRRAQTLLDQARVTLALADDLSAANDPTLTEALTDGDARLSALVDAYRRAKAAAGFSAAATELMSALINDTDQGVVVAMLAAAVVRGEAEVKGDAR